MNMAGVFPVAVMAFLALSAVSARGAVIDVPDVLIDEYPVSSQNTDGNTVRTKRQFSFGGFASRDHGRLRADVGRTFFDNGRTSWSGSGFSQADFARNSKPFVSSGVSSTLSHQLWQGRNQGDALGLSTTVNKNWNHGTGYNPASGSIRLDANKNLYSNDRTNVQANAFHQVDVAQGSKPFHSSGIGLEATHNLDKDLQLYGGGHVNKNSGSPRDIGVELGIRKTF